ncbi:MAG: hypothetical protein K9H26_00085 [Prolixibacteraceae bacterium]|nr:hypothetical protein [Prolixibacteraceae bacterium]
MKNKNSLYQLPSLIIALLVVIVTLAGIIDQGFYNARLNTITSSELLGQDSVSLIISIAFILLLLVEKEKLFIKIINLGILAYFICTYGYFCFSIVSSPLFLCYMLILALSLFVFIYKLNSLIKVANRVETNKYYPRKTISFFFLFAVVIMLFKEIPYLVDKTIINNESIILFDAFYILDLAIVFPAMVIVAIMNFSNKPSSVIFSGIFLVKLITLMPALLFNDIFHFIQKGHFLDISFDIIALLFTAFSLCLLFFYKRGIGAVHQ